ncbi:hypothetical protein GOP47_0022567 [Adiantum capillus-veneris]|uniref:Serine/threonine-protein kinase 11-interacting protein n=1 Tax=Adiantum capillus-veneris TaxID=13818 RepID=A0A9D4U6R1_ADICA|nr:hypothetical protein GOP47_0022567 [Adiantum capillus-veneris]
MAIVTGDRYLDLLARFVEEQAGGLLDGSLVLKLNPVGLHYVQTRLDALHELERLRAGAPVDYLRAYISDLGDHRALEQLSRVLSLLTSVKVVSLLPSPARDPSPVTLSPFGRLKSLELRGCDLSTSAARGFLQLMPILERLICHNSADALRHIFMERILEVKDSPVWSRLAYVSCTSNGMVLMDDSLQLLPAVQFLDLSRNHFAKVGNLHCCSKLKFLDLGFNQLRNVSSLRQIKSPITKLVLKNNALASVYGIAALSFLEALDLSNNLISKFKEIQSLAKLPSLQILLLEGNPISAAVWYREEVFSFFQDPSKVSLDGRKILKSESWTVNSIKSRRLKQEALYGAYAPAEIVAEMQARAVPSVEGTDSASDTGTSNPRGKVSRLALIHDVETLMKEVVEQDDSPRFLSKDVKEKWQDVFEGEHDKAKAIHLMEKVEALKEEGSNTWLQELKDLLDNNEHVSEHSKKVFSSTMESGSKELRRLRSRRHSRRQRRYLKKKLSKYKQEGADQELEGSLHSQSEKDAASQSQSSEGRSKGHTPPSGIQSDSAAASPRTSATYEVSSDREDSIGPLKQPFSGAEIARSKQHGLVEPVHNEQTSMDFGSWRLIDEVIDSQGTRGALSSPPHYHEEVLQKRQDLEEELLRLSFDSGCAPSSSESESSSDDSLIMISGSSRSEDGSPQVMGYLNRESSMSKCWDIWQNPNNQVEINVGNHTTKERLPSDLSDQKADEIEGFQNSEKATEASRSGHSSPSCTDDIRANAGGGQSLENCKPRRRRKPRRVPTTELYKENDGESGLAPVLHESSSTPDCNTTLLSASKVSSSATATHGSLKQAECGVHDSVLDIDDEVKMLFTLRIANVEEGEECSKCVRCGCIRLWEDSPVERDVHFLLSNKDNLYMIAKSISKDSELSASGLGSGMYVLASHGLQEVKKIMVGLGLQAIRVDIGHGASYLILTRDIALSREILEMFRKVEINGPAPDFESWEQKQLKMFEELVLGGTQANVLMYLMPFFSPGNSRVETEEKHQFYPKWSPVAVGVFS